MKRKIQLLTKSQFPSHSFFDHLLRGTEYFRNRDFERAAEEWGAASWLDYKPPQILKPTDGRIFCGGFIREVPFLFFLHAIFTSKANGIGALKTNGISKNLAFLQGRLVQAATSRPEERIGNFILGKKHLSPDALDLMAADARQRGKRIGQYLVEKEILDPEALREILSLQVEHIIADIFNWQRGYFYFLEKPIARETIVNFDPLNIARIATCQGYSIADFRSKVASRKIIYRPSPYAESQKNKILKKLTERHKFVFSLIDGTRNIAQIAKFSGVEEAQAINILYQLNTAGMIRQSREIIEYEDKHYNEISDILDSLLEIYADISQILFYELGAGAAKTIQRAPGLLSNHLKNIFAQVPLTPPGRLRKETILGNMSRYYPDPSQRHFFIEAFYELFEYLLGEIDRFLGKNLRYAAKARITIEIKTIERYAGKTALRNHLLEIFAKLSR